MKVLRPTPSEDNPHGLSNYSDCIKDCNGNIIALITISGGYIRVPTPFYTDKEGLDLYQNSSLYPYRPDVNFRPI